LISHHSIIPKIVVKVQSKIDGSISATDTLV